MHTTWHDVFFCWNRVETILKQIKPDVGRSWMMLGENTLEAEETKTFFFTKWDISDGIDPASLNAQVMSLGTHNQQTCTCHSCWHSMGSLNKSYESSSNRLSIRGIAAVMIKSVSNQIKSQNRWTSSTAFVTGSLLSKSGKNGGRRKTVKNSFRNRATEM